MALQDIRTPTLGQALRPNVWDVVALILVIGAMVLIVYGGEQTALPLSTLDVTPVSLDPANLPVYALRTTMRMLLAIVCSIIFTFIYAALAAKSRRAEMVLIPLLDILQSVPILGFLTFTVVFFLNLFPGQRVRRRTRLRVRDLHQPGLEHDLQHVPVDAQRPEGSGRSLAKLSPKRMAALLAARRAVRHAGPDLEHDDVDVGRLVLRGGVGGDHRRQHHGHAARASAPTSHLAIQKQNLPAIGYAILTMLLVIIAYDQLLFRPVVAWADKFRFEQTASATAPTSWMLDLFRRTRALRALTYPFAALNKAISNLHIALPSHLRMPSRQAARRRALSMRSGSLYHRQAPATPPGGSMNISRRR